MRVDSTFTHMPSQQIYIYKLEIQNSSVIDDSIYTIEDKPMSNFRSPDRPMKVVIIGDPRMGKTTLQKTFGGQGFRERYQPTLGADYLIQHYKKESQQYIFTLWDLSGQKQFFNVHPQYYVGSHGAVVLIDIDSIDTENITRWINKYILYAGKYSGPILVVLNKIDLLKTKQGKIEKLFKETIAQVNLHYNKKFKIHGIMTSAKTGENVQSSMLNFFDELIDFYRENEPKGKRLF